ncbi:hypothetical protein [Paenibacillus xylanexedens]|uniref:hypothetical protein n=1 Tax=Paenibacillus xylanexedens TaxID=528191 RepID=UPI000F525DA7|nr:hypothetical protein [Paenibacillus xylanexedens]RPK29858.1 hypothetical protein EDO6_00482 [Paenibacillus xylanexedens]
MSKRHYAYSCTELFKLIEALELLNKHYMITTLEQVEEDVSWIKKLSHKPRWIVEETECGNVLEYDLDDAGWIKANPILSSINEYVQDKKHRESTDSEDIPPGV